VNKSRSEIYTKKQQTPKSFRVLSCILNANLEWFALTEEYLIQTHYRVHWSFCVSAEEQGNVA
jgi:hypothetical protein